MPTSEGGGFVHVSADEEATARVLRGVGPDKPTAPPEPPASRPRGFDWGAGSVVKPMMTQQERRDVIRKARLTHGVPDRFQSPATLRDAPGVSYDVTDADRAAAAHGAPAEAPSEPEPPDDFDHLSWPDSPAGQEIVVGGHPETIVELPPDSRPGSPEPAWAVEAAPGPVSSPAGDSRPRVREPAPKPAWRRDRDARIVALYRAGTSTAEIGTTMECGQGTIYSALRDAGVEIGERSRGKPDAERVVRAGYDYPVDVVEAVRRLYGEGLSQEKIGNRLGRSQIWVSTLMRREGIERRRSGARPKILDDAFVAARPPALPEVEGLPDVEAVVRELADFPWRMIYEQLTTLAELVRVSAERIGVSVRDTDPVHP